MSVPLPKVFELRRVTALVGPFGSGKTELSIGLALLLAGRAPRSPGKVVLADLDVIKPYFRSREVSDSIRQVGIDIISPRGIPAASDLPILSPELRGSVQRADLQVILDVGGDPVGARALGSISDVVLASDYDLLLVLNRYRPFMDSLEGVVAHLRQIVAASHLALTGVISNTHLMAETTEEDVDWGLELAQAVAGELGVPLRLLAVPEHLAEPFGRRPDLPPVVVIRRQMMPNFLGGVILTGAGNNP